MRTVIRYGTLMAGIFFIVPLFSMPEIGGNKDILHMTVFVHGSVGSAFWLLDPKNVWHDTLNPDSRYLRSVKVFRNDPTVGQNQILGECGLHQWHPNTFSTTAFPQASNVLIPAFDAVAHWVNGYDKTRLYYTFGHLGILSQTYRSQAAAELYHQLADEYSQLKKQYKEVIIDVVGHSHGGNILLMLARYEDIYNKGLQINDCILLATPVQAETAACAYMPFFKRVINIYSDGDTIQCIDKMSTPSRASYQTFNNKKLRIARLSQSNVYDVRMCVNKYTKSIGHANLWLMGMKHPVCQLLDILPAVVLVPCIVDLLNKKEHDQHIDCTIHCAFHSFYLSCTDHKKQTGYVRSREMRFFIKDLVSQSRKLLSPSFRLHIPLLNMHDLRAAYRAYCSLWDPLETCHSANDMISYKYV